MYCKGLRPCNTSEINIQIYKQLKLNDYENKNSKSVISVPRHQ